MTTGNVRAILGRRGFRQLLAVRLSSQLGDGWFQAGLAGSVFFNPERAPSPLAIATAFAVLLVFVFFGAAILGVLGLSDPSLTIAGGVILFLIALRMIFRHPEGIFGDSSGGEPFIVPLATPAIAGPAAIATVMLLVSRAPERVLEWCIAVTVALLVAAGVLTAAERIANLAGERALLAFERLMGLILTAIAVEMLLRGIETFVRGL